MPRSTSPRSSCRALARFVKRARHRRRQAIRRRNAADRVERANELAERAAVIGRRGGVARRSLHRDAQPERHLRLHLDAPERNVIDDGLVVAAFVEHEAGVREELGMLLEQLARQPLTPPSSSSATAR